MEHEIINNTQITRPLIDALCLPAVKNLQKRVLLLLLAGFPTIILLYCHMLDWKLNKFSPFTLFIIAAGTGFLAWRYFTFGPKTAELTEIQLRESSGGHFPLVQYRFYADRFDSFNHSTGGTKSMSYAEIKNVYKTDTAYIVQSSKGFSPIDINGFEPGDISAFEALLCQHTRKIKRLSANRK